MTNKLVVLGLVVGSLLSQPACLRCSQSEKDPEKPDKAEDQKHFQVVQAIRIGKLTAVWANSGEDKVTQEELRASKHPQGVLNTIWDGKQVELFGAKNEVISFNLVLEAAQGEAKNTQVRFERLESLGGGLIASKMVDRHRLFDWIERPIELFFVRYLQIRGLSVFNYAANYDERHVPKRMQRSWKGAGKAKSGTGWKDRPGADKFYPDIAVPMELVPSFDVQAKQNQSIWVDIYIPKHAAAGIYRGEIAILQQQARGKIPVRLEVLDFELPDRPSCKTMLHLVYEDINHRYLGIKWPRDQAPEARLSRLLVDRHFLLAHRHRISLIDSNYGPEVWTNDAPRPPWKARLDASLFSPAHGYHGPGVGVGNDIFSIGTYGAWSWKAGGLEAMYTHADNWVNWFEKHAPLTEYFLYLVDEPPEKEYGMVEQWSRWLDSNPGPGRKLRSMSTVSIPVAKEKMPSLDIACSTASFGLTRKWRSAVAELKKKGRPVWIYNSMRPACGTVTVEDDGIAMRQMAWAHYKLGIDRWFLWASTFYDNNHCSPSVQTNVFRQAQTSGCDIRSDPILGRTGWNYSNGEGVLFYPGTDRLYPNDSYDVQGPFASLRLKHWRRGIQDVEYLVLAAHKKPTAVRKLLEKMVPRVLWELGVHNEKDPTYVITDISWPINPDTWEQARRKLADWITGS